jgi:hypothetical protein
MVLHPFATLPRKDFATPGESVSSLRGDKSRSTRRALSTRTANAGVAELAGRAVGVGGASFAAAGDVDAVRISAVHGRVAVAALASSLADLELARFCEIATWGIDGVGLRFGRCCAMREAA